MWIYFRASDKLYISSFADLAFLILGHHEIFWLYQAGAGTHSAPAQARHAAILWANHKVPALIQNPAGEGL